VIADELELVAWLQVNSDFFERHAEILGQVRLRSPHGSRAISLHQRQIELVREKHRALEQKLSDLFHYAEENDAIQRLLLDWTVLVLKNRHAQAQLVPMLEGFQTVFGLEAAVFLFWGATLNGESSPIEVSADAQAGISKFKHPQLLPVTDQPFAVYVPEMRSMAVVPLRLDQQCVGALILGSADAEHFLVGMDTMYLKHIAALIEAMLEPIVVTDAQQ
jgi:uncharacterized protein